MIGCTTCHANFTATGEYVGCKAHGGALSIDPLIAATIDYEVAQDDYAAIEWRIAVKSREYGYHPGASTKAEDRAFVEQTLQAQIDAGVRFWLEADAAGLVNLFDEKTTDESMAERIAEVEALSASVGRRMSDPVRQAVYAR